MSGGSTHAARRSAPRRVRRPPAAWSRKQWGHAEQLLKLAELHGEGRLADAAGLGRSRHLVQASTWPGVSFSLSWEVESGDGFERFGRGAVAQAVGQRLEPRGILGLQRQRSATASRQRSATASRQRWGRLRRSAGRLVRAVTAAGCVTRRARWRAWRSALLAPAPKRTVSNCLIRRMDSLCVGIPPVHRVRWRHWKPGHC